MSRHGGRRGVRSSMDYKNAVAAASDSQWRAADEKASAACEADPADVEGYDPACRFRDHPLHACVRRDMTLVTAGVPCWYETQAQVAEQGEVLHAAEDAARP